MRWFSIVVLLVPRRELTRLSWPVPWWVAVGPGLILGVVTYGLVSNASSWPYVAPARLSGMIGESVGVTAPIACVVGAWVAERFTNRFSPIAWPVLPRASGAQGIGVLAVVLVWWVGLGTLGGVVAQMMVLRDATGGEFYAVESVIGGLGLAFFVVSGFLLGGTISRWHAPIWALVWALAWVWVIPVYSGSVFPYPSRNVEYFLFTGHSASDHRSLDGSVLAVIVAWWLLVLASLVVALWAWYRARARVTQPAGAMVGALAPFAVAVAGIGIAHLLPSPFVDPAPDEPFCAREGRVEYCLTREQQGLLDEFVAAASPAVDRMAWAWPREIERVVSFSVAGRGNSPGPGSIGVNVSSVSGIPDALMDVGVGLAGLASCDPSESDRDSVGWALEFGKWMAQSAEANPQMDPRAKSLWDSSDEDIRTWYAGNAADLLACRYTGSGPG